MKILHRKTKVVLVRTYLPMNIYIRKEERLKINNLSTQEFRKGKVE